MTFPNIPDSLVDDAILNLAGENASRAAVFTTRQQVNAVIVALQNAVSASAHCDICGHFHPLTEHPANAHSAETTPAVHSYAAEAKLERESGGDKTGTWDDRTWPILNSEGEVVATVSGHDHAMCDPDRNCGPEPLSVTLPASGMFSVNLGVNDTAAPAEGTVTFTPLHAPEPGSEEEARYKDAMARLAAAAKIQEEAPLLDRLAANMQILEDTPVMDRRASRMFAYGVEEDGSGGQRMFPGGRMWAESADRDGDDDCCGPEKGEPGIMPRTDPEDKLRIIADIVNAQAPLGSDLADFRRRLLLILDIQ